MAEVKEVKIEKIVFSKTNPRKEFHKNSLQELADSIETSGLVNPVTLRKKGNSYELVSGERRVRACKLLKKKTVLSIVRTLTDEQVLEIQYIENLQRQDVHPLDEATFISGMIDTGKFSIETIADKIGKTSAYVASRLQLTKLAPEIRKAYAEGKIELGHALLIAKYPDADQQKIFTHITTGYSRTPTVAELKSYVTDHFMINLNNAPFNRKDKLLLPDAGSCEECPHRTGNNEDLFAEFSGKNICPNGNCYKEKVNLHIQMQLDKAEEAGTPLVKVSGVNLNTTRKNILCISDYTITKKPEGKNVQKAIYMDGPNKGKLVNVIVKTADAKGETENAAQESKPPTIKEMVEEENKPILAKRDIEFRTALGAQFLKQNLSGSIITLFARILLNQEFGYDLGNYFLYEKEPDFNKLDDGQFISAFNTGFINCLCDPDGGTDLKLLIKVADYFAIDHKEIKIKIWNENQLVTADDIKKRMKKLPEEKLKDGADSE